MWNCHEPENTDQTFEHEDFWQRGTIPGPAAFSTHVLCAYGHSDTFAPFNVTDLVMAHVNHRESTTSDSISVCPYSQLDSEGSLPETSPQTANINLGTLPLSHDCTHTHTHANANFGHTPHGLKDLMSEIRWKAPVCVNDGAHVFGVYVQLVLCIITLFIARQFSLLPAKVYTAHAHTLTRHKRDDQLNGLLSDHKNPALSRRYPFQTGISDKS